MNNLPTPPQHWRILAASAIQIPKGQEDERFAALKAEVPGRNARRMSRLGLMLNHLLLQIPVCEQTALIYASGFAESRTLETYLESFPTPSPLGFQSSIHPGGVEQGLILRQQSVREFLPLAGSEQTAATLFYNMRLSTAPRILLLAGEESATWLTSMHLAASENFACALLLEPVTTACSSGDEKATAIGHLQADTTPTSMDTTAADSTTAMPLSASKSSLCSLTEAILGRHRHTCSGADNTCWTLHWQHSNG